LIYPLAAWLSSGATISQPYSRQYFITHITIVDLKNIIYSGLKSSIFAKGDFLLLSGRRKYPLPTEK